MNLIKFSILLFILLIFAINVLGLDCQYTEEVSKTKIEQQYYTHSGEEIIPLEIISVVPITTRHQCQFTIVIKNYNEVPVDYVLRFNHDLGVAEIKGQANADSETALNYESGYIANSEMIITCSGVRNPEFRIQKSDSVVIKNKEVKYIIIECRKCPTNSDTVCLDDKAACNYGHQCGSNNCTNGICFNPATMVLPQPIQPPVAPTPSVVNTPPVVPTPSDVNTSPVVNTGNVSVSKSNSMNILLTGMFFGMLSIIILVCVILYCTSEAKSENKITVVITYICLILAFFAGFQYGLDLYSILTCEVIVLIAVPVLCWIIYHLPDFIGPRPGNGSKARSFKSIEDFLRCYEYCKENGIKFTENAFIMGIYYSNEQLHILAEKFYSSEKY